MLRRRVVAVVALAVLAVGRAAAHGGSLAQDIREPLTIPTWLFLSTGGAAVGASFLLASFVTDRALIDAIHDWRRAVAVPARRAAVASLRVLGIAGVVLVVVVGYLGPTDASSNAAILLVWVGWWAGLSMSAYLVGNSWPALNPWRTVAELVPSLDLRYPDRLGTWPSVFGLLALVYLEVVSPLAENASLLATTVLAYSAVTLAGAVLFGPSTWFGQVDPPSRVFRYYGRVAPVSADDDGLTLRLPGTALSERRLVDGRDEVAFVLALLWVTTFDGFVSTPAWRGLAGPFVGLGIPPLGVYLLALLLGFGLFWSLYLLAARLSRSTAETFLTPAALAARFAPPLLAIVAGYHFAHYLDYFLGLAPSLLQTLAAPLTARSTVLVLSIPGWFGGVSMASIIVGHLLAIWVAHAAAYDLFPGRLQAIRSQYPFIAVMVVYTMTSLWVISQPDIPLPYL
ncbi:MULTISPECIES: hypothetical protein [Halomicrobium]|uniref:Uncharacterized protein n=2 Tax=Halomicrobium mukohataei TaxID=57705 RepID=C7P4Q0_HALMD|nr:MULTISPECIES: hypothetical protein [Halomicrobium]ACV48072.1 conserved hypothetical protein [Halomicrobium mukohataei DSM 12286]QCD66503.1 hypothetical protein E5139_12910 [Halomicrobium mukohataei]QFR21309.1 hypothetical protein GBQ70_12925 [Halomicrobium sp. ZPS1]